MSEEFRKLIVEKFWWPFNINDVLCDVYVIQKIDK